MSVAEFKPWPKTPRLFRDMIVTEKIDGTNACVVISEDGRVSAQSRNRIIVPGNDNAGFAAWVESNRADLLALGPGCHYGERWGKGIQRGYDLDHKRFSLFNTARFWSPFNANDGDSTVCYQAPCCHVVPVLKRYTFNTERVQDVLEGLRDCGSEAAPGFMRPEGVCVFVPAANQVFKALLENDDIPKGLAA